MDWSQYRRPNGSAEIREFYDTPLNAEFQRLSSLYRDLANALEAGGDSFVRGRFEETKRDLAAINNRMMIAWHERRLRREATHA